MKKVLDYVSIAISGATAVGVVVFVEYFVRDAGVSHQVAPYVFSVALVFFLLQVFSVLFIMQKVKGYSEKRWLTTLMKVWAVVAVPLAFLLVIYAFRSYGAGYYSYVSNFDCFPIVTTITPCNPISFWSYIVTRDLSGFIMLAAIPFTLIFNPIYVAYQSMKRKE